MEKIGRWSQTPGRTGRLTVGRNVTLTLTSVERCNKLDNPMEFGCCELSLWDVGAEALGYFGNKQDGERQPLKTATKQRQRERDCVLVCVNIVNCSRALHQRVQ
jgi:hypothetical protein